MRRISVSIQASTSAISSSGRRPWLGIGAPMDTRTTPGLSTKLRRGQQRAEATAIGTIGTPAAMASRDAPVL